MGQTVAIRSQWQHASLRRRKQKGTTLGDFIPLTIYVIKYILNAWLGRPHADTIHGSRVQNLRELRIQHEGRPYRVLYVFDPRRTGVLLIGGDKTGNPRWYEELDRKSVV